MLFARKKNVWKKDLWKVLLFKVREAQYVVQFGIVVFMKKTMTKYGQQLPFIKE